MVCRVITGYQQHRCSRFPEARLWRLDTRSGTQDFSMLGPLANIRCIVRGGVLSCFDGVGAARFVSYGKRRQLAMVASCVEATSEGLAVEAVVMEYTRSSERVG
eukprot:3548466-Pyramimonas_sp.AAC.2